MRDTPKSGSEEVMSSLHYDVREPKYSLWRRAQIPLIAGGVYSVVRTVGPTLRYEILGWQHAERAYEQGKRLILTFWHCAIFGIMWWTRNRGIVVMNSTNFDGQWMRRVIERLGYGTAQGSSTRGGLRGLATMAQQMEAGRDVAFTIDGPRGPRFVAKPGPVMLARRTGFPISTFHVGYEHAKVFKNSWDQFQMPRPYSRVVIAFAPMIDVPAGAGREIVEAKHALMQSELERARHLAEKWFSLSPEEQAQEREQWNA
jgi:lysophospholipid acyltransferase (LPLAT)-like uncharacterized protein